MKPTALLTNSNDNVATVTKEICNNELVLIRLNETMLEIKANATIPIYHKIALCDIPKGADVIWMSQFLDCFSQDDIAELLRRSKEAMTKDTSLFIMETYWDKQKFEASTYCLHATSLYFTNIANGCSQMYHSDDMLRLIEQSGLYVDESFEDIGVSHTLFKCKVK